MMSPSDTSREAESDTASEMASGFEPVARAAIAERIEGLESLDVLAEPLQGAARAAVPQDSGVKDILSGTWLGHPLHPPLTDLVIGAWTSAALLDLFGGDH